MDQTSSARLLPAINNSHSTQQGTIKDIRGQNDDQFMADVAPLLDELEAVRLVKLKAYEWRKKIGLAVGTILLPFCGWIDWLLLTVERGSDDSYGGVTALMVSAIYYWVTDPKRKYAKEYKVQIMPRLIALFGDMKYHADGKIPIKQMEPSKLIPRHHRYKSEDHFEGVYKGVILRFAEIELEERRRSGKRTHYVTVFKGLAILVDHPRPKFLGHTVLRSNSSKVGKWFKEKSTGLSHANLVDPEFEKMFDVYTNDQVEARYLIDPAMVETLKKLAAAFEAGSLMAAYYEAKTLVLIPSKKNHFELQNIKIPATDPLSIQEMKHDISRVLDLIDQLEMYELGNRSVLGAQKGPVTVQIKTEPSMTENAIPAQQQQKQEDFLLPPD